MSPRADEILDGLDPQQREVALAPVGPVQVLAGAGTGKTRAITHRIAYGVLSGQVQPSTVLAVTFTARAAGEMRVRLRDLGVAGVQARTFHAAALRQLTYFWPQAVGGPAPTILAQKAPVVAEALSRLRLAVDRTAVRDVSAEIEWAKVSLLTPATYPSSAAAAGRAPAGLDATAMSRVMTTYEDCKADRGVIDFEDVLLITSGILAEREEIARMIRSQYRHFVVDEYQDVNALQQRLLDLWLGERQTVCVVGDPAQTIYSFTGASPAYLLDFTARHPDACRVELVRNYRSTPQIVALANLVRAAPGASAASGVTLRAQKSDGPAPSLRVYPDDAAEAEGIAARVTAIMAAGASASTIAVLFRTNAQSEAIESALASAAVPFVLRGGERFFARREVRDAILLLRGAARSDEPDRPLADRVGDVLAGLGWTAQAPRATGAVRERWESLSALVALATDIEARPATGEASALTLADLVRELDERSASAHAPTVDGVTLASLHAAKGLEWDVVFVAGCSDGLLPITLAESPEAVQEERRLLYVGLTRAREELHLSYAASRTVGGKATRRPSRFLEAAARVLGADAVAPGRDRAPRRRGEARAARRSTCRACGGELSSAAMRKVGRCEQCPPTYDEAVFEALRAWRLAAASAASVPAYVVFTDATLVAIAETRPSTPAQLAGISGVGPRKLEQYADAVLAVLAVPQQ